MKTIPMPDLTDAIILKPAEMNRIHFGGNHTPLTASQLKALAEGRPAVAMPENEGAPGQK